MSKTKRLEWLRKHNRKWRTRESSLDRYYRLRGITLYEESIASLDDPPISDNPPIMIDDEKIIVTGVRRLLVSFVRDYKKMPSAQSIEVIDEASTLSVEAIDQMLKAMSNYTVHPSGNTALPSA